MSLEKIQSNKFFISELFNNNVIYLEQNSEQKAEKGTIKFKGNNLKNFCIIYKLLSSDNLSASALEMVTKMLEAYKHSMQDCALIDWAENIDLNHEVLKKELNPKIVLLFDVLPQDIKLPILFPQYKNQIFNDISFICANNINVMPNDKAAKSALWKCLQAV